jgi:hypothetical protein
MTQPASPARTVIRQQLLELDGILAQAQKDLNTVAGNERVLKWKAKTIPLLAEHLGPQAAQRLAGTSPGPSFTSDLLEELSDHIEVYRAFMLGLLKEYESK